MSATSCLHELFIASARQNPQAVAVVEPGQGSISYGELDALSDRLRDRLAKLGVGRGDRVGIYLPKSIDSVATLLGALKAGAAYVPVDPGAPAARGAYILHNCRVKVVVVAASLADKLGSALGELGATPASIAVDVSLAAGSGLHSALDAADRQTAAVAADKVGNEPDDLAYILYTSGSTGKPKGVMLSHENALSFVDWCSESFSPTAADRFSSHAPFHFDLSILDIHVCLKHGATLILIGEDIGKDAPRLAQLIADERISIWYSAPSILALLAQFGGLARHDYGALRQVLFAGEVFAVKHLRTLSTLWPRPRYFNLYGPTETNVCTWYEVPLPVPAERNTPYPIGKVCSHLRARVLDDGGAAVGRGSEGELCIAGPAVMRGYWELPEQTARGFFIDADGTAWYRTGDIVNEADDACYTYLGRRDRMVKRRGYRVELGEIEAGLYRHAKVKEAAVLAFADEQAGVSITAFLSSDEVKRPSLIEIKRFCAENLPLYMIPDKFSWFDSLPKTSTDKIDYQRLKEIG
ncbi:MAG: amino acid adenylation domain-containing protein [Candidatus Accumulibacter sp.]|uniref:amino acid adenylation domain-containing protein n=1 Tax=Accumulibacter sp. TaxID=2053492 RepID=UPI0025E14A2E|nr:amino acid adenylation domain-containing protein [Accumulibacter sp.]MCP5247295.1 amino acid adenylation domain-containing protein [Accumulibacter sp.]